MPSIICLSRINSQWFQTETFRNDGSCRDYQNQYHGPCVCNATKGLWNSSCFKSCFRVPGSWDESEMRETHDVNTINWRNFRENSWLSKKIFEEAGRPELSKIRRHLTVRGTIARGALLLGITGYSDWFDFCLCNIFPRDKRHCRHTGRGNLAGTGHNGSWPGNCDAHPGFL